MLHSRGGVDVYAAKFDDAENLVWWKGVLPVD